MSRGFDEQNQNCACKLFNTFGTYSASPIFNLLSTSLVSQGGLGGGLQVRRVQALRSHTLPVGRLRRWFKLFEVRGIYF